MRNKLNLLIGVALLMGGAVFHWSGQPTLLIGVMLFMPLLDRDWQRPLLSKNRTHILAWLILAFITLGLVICKPGALSFLFVTLAFAALPEEWFFRAWFMTRLGSGWGANFATSVLFALVHAATQGGMRGVLVFIPSLFFGWAYQKSRDLVLVVLVHAFANLLYFLFLANYEKQFIAAFLG